MIDTIRCDFLLAVNDADDDDEDKDLGVEVTELSATIDDEETVIGTVSVSVVTFLLLGLIMIEACCLA
ncbi:hypothetical protein QR98_0058550 [Sarcoptes scabiei]|uniref:Uncharacterized protein n=1 Tax=Sarcoptes scabiei TaxID=52283 RepID=A0A132A8R6_SARSC|nr:hypothetical protein QR98_0058550 [Sarcoptes scabiei]